MPKFSRRSTERLASSHPDLQTIFDVVVAHFDCSVLCGHRGEAEQNQMVADGRSKLSWPHSKHNSRPSMAVDVAPYPIDWRDMKRWYLFGGYVLATARQLYGDGQIEHLVRWGGDWDLDTDLSDQRFNDLPHFELYVPERGSF